MITNVRTFFLRGLTDSMDPPLRVFHTVFFPTPTTVTATAAVSMASIGQSPTTAGTVGALIWKAGIARANGQGTDTVDLSGSFDNNGGTFVRCVFLTFALSLRRSGGVGKYTVYIHG